MKRPDYFAMTETSEYECRYGVYAVVFDKGTKFGRSKDVRNRVNHYRKPWCFDVVDVVALDLPDQLLVSVESRAIHHGFYLAKIGPPRGREEFVPGLNRQGAVRALKLALIDHADELSRLDLVTPIDPRLRMQKCFSNLSWTGGQYAEPS